MTDYPRTHPLFDMDERWIAECASVVIKSIDKMPHSAHTGQFPARGLLALVADHRRLEARVVELETQTKYRGQRIIELQSETSRLKTESQPEMARQLLKKDDELCKAYLNVIELEAKLLNTLVGH